MSAWDDELAKVLTTFYLPVNVQTGEMAEGPPDEWRLPFSYLRIVESWTLPPAARRRMEAQGQMGLDSLGRGREHLRDVTFTGGAEYLFQEIDAGLLGGVLMLSRSVYRVPGFPERVVYEPPIDRTKPWTPEQAASAEGEARLVLGRFAKYLDDRSARYIEQPTSRQVRRSMGVTSDYREYIIIPKERSERYASAHTRAEIIKRLRALHAVRGHMRRYKSGKTVFVRPHSRGTGDALQVKDYIQHP